MSTETFIDYKKNFLPGYTGHVPKKTELFGCSAGDINALVTGTGQKPSPYSIEVAMSKPTYEQRDYFKSKNIPEDAR
jgi:hypothetical protein